MPSTTSRVRTAASGGSPRTRATAGLPSRARSKVNNLPPRLLALLLPCWLLLLLAVTPAPTPAVELVTLTPQTWDAYVPAGKEVDCVYGDFVLRNDKLVALVANPIDGRHANMTVRDAGGAVIDLTVRDRQSDQLSAFYPGARAYKLRFKQVSVVKPKVYEVADVKEPRVVAAAITLRCAATAEEGKPAIEVAYTLEEGKPFLLIETVFSNPGAAPLEVPLVDDMRADRSFDKSPNGPASFFWVYDKWFGQAYGLTAEGHELNTESNANNSTIRYTSDGKNTITLPPGGQHKLVRRFFPGSNLLEVKGVAAQLGGGKTLPIEVIVRDSAGKTVPEADIVVRPVPQAGKEAEVYAWGRTFDDGKLVFSLPAGDYDTTVSALGRGSRTLRIQATEANSARAASYAVALDQPGYVAATINDAGGGPIPCKVQFLGVEGSESPDFGPDSGEHAVKNLYYSQNGRFRQVMPPGKYDVIISHGPEFDAVFTRIEVRQGQQTPLEAKLVRSVETAGWVSSDFHSHSSPSGDNTSSQLGRVLNLVCEHIEFAPCTEHNRLSTYAPHIEKLGIERFMASCTGMELTGIPGDVDHQNAFPLVMKPRTQDGGAPERDDNPEVQIERLAWWDDKSEKLVQQNHPDIGHVFFDKDGDGKPDGGYKGSLGHMDVIEVHPPQYILEMKATFQSGENVYNRTIFNWLQLLNQGHRIPGVVNTDAHYTFHGSGWLRNYLKSPTDEPAEIKTLDMVHAAEQGHVVMTNGPFLEVSLEPAASAKPGRGDEKQEQPRPAIPGDALVLSGGAGLLSVRVQCPNWLDIDRVQVLLNSRPVPELNFTRAANPDRFSDKTVKFDAKLPLSLKADTHVIVVAIGEGKKLGPVMGPAQAGTPPVAVSNPIWVDVDGGGFKPNGDTLGVPLPVKGGGRPPR